MRYFSAGGRRGSGSQKIAAKKDVEDCTGRTPPIRAIGIGKVSTRVPRIQGWYPRRCRGALIITDRIASWSRIADNRGHAEIASFLKLLELNKAAEQGDLDMVRRFMEDRGGVKLPDTAQMRVFLCAVANGRLQVVSYLLDRGIDYSA